MWPSYDDYLDTMETWSQNLERLERQYWEDVEAAAHWEQWQIDHGQEYLPDEFYYTDNSSFTTT